MLALVAVALGVWRWRASHFDAVPTLAAIQQLTHADGEEREPSISADGARVVYVARGEGGTDLYLVTANGAPPVNLTRSPEAESSPAIAPDGAQIAFVVRDGARSAIHVMDVADVSGASKRVLVDDGAHPAWSPDGREIFYESAPWTDANARFTDSEVFAVDVGSGVTRAIAAQDAVQPSVSPDGQWVVAWRRRHGQRDLVVVPSAGGPAHALTDDAAHDSHPVWGPDGRSVFFLSERGGARSLWRVPIDPRTGAREHEPSGASGVPSALMGLSASRTSRLVVSVGSQQTDVLRVPVDGHGAAAGPVETMLSSARDFVVTSVSPDGRALAAHALEPHEDIVRISLDGAERVLLTDDAWSQRAPAYAPRGDRIAFYANTSGRWTTWIARTDGSDARALEMPAGGERTMEPVWSPDGTQLAGTGLREGLLIIVDVLEGVEAGRATRQRTIMTRKAGEVFLRPTDWSRDGARLLGFSVVDDVVTGVAWLELSGGRVRALPLAGPDAPVTAPRFLVDGRHVTYARASGDVVVLDLEAADASAGARVIHRAPQGVEVTASVVGPDGALWITTSRRQADLWLVELDADEN